MSDEKPKSSWIVRGLTFGVTLFLGLFVIWPLIQGESIDWIRGGAISVVVGLLFGYTTEVIKPKA